MRLRQHKKGSAFFIVMATAVCFDTAAAFSPLDDELPIDATGVMGYYEAGSIDSMQLLRLLPLYRRPLQVPAGEVVELLEVFPELSGYLPVEEAQLARYRPWDRDAQERFFSDYPVLNRLRPVLQFEYRSTGHRSSVSFFMNNPANGTPAKHSSRFSVAPVRQVRLRGTVDATSDYARWERRVLSVRPVPSIRMQLGNFTMTTDRGLFYGYFPDDSVAEHAVGDNWLYGSATCWNGVKATVASRNKTLFRGYTPSLSGFFHTRPTETVTGGWAAVAGKAKTGFTCGVSRLITDENPEGITYLNTAIKATREGVSTELHCGVSFTDGKLLVPLLWNGTVSTGGYRTRLTVARLPAGFSAPRSAFLRRFAREFDASDTLKSSIILARIHSNVTADGFVRVNPRCELWFENGNIHHGSFQLHTVLHRRITEGTLLFSVSFPGGIGSTADASVQGSFSWMPLSELAVVTFQRYRIGHNGRWRYRGRLSPEMTFFSRLHIVPAFSCVFESGHFPRYLAGARQKLMLFDRTQTEFLIEQDLREYASGEHLRIEGRATFYF